MSEPTTPLPTDVEDRTAHERPMLEAFLRYFRAVLVRKAEGITEREARIPACPPSDLSLLGLIRHMADVERFWAQAVFAGKPDEPIFYGDAHPTGDRDGDFHPTDDASLVEAFDVLRAQLDAADAVYADADLDQLAMSTNQRVSLRWIYVHLIEEYARHCGHADLIREAIDGATGD